MSGLLGGIRLFADFIRTKPGYDDQQGDVSTALIGTAQWTTEQIRDTGFIVPWLRHDQDDFFQIRVQFTHRRKLQTNLASLHIHAIPGGAVSGNVYFSYAYTWVKADDTIPAISGWTSGNITTAVAGTDQWKHKVYNLLTNISPPTSESHSSMLLVKLSRLGTNILDTYTDSKPSGTAQANFGVLYLDCHTQVDKPGSDNELTDTF